MHIYVLHWSAVNIAGFNVDATPIDQFFMLGTFGISTFLTRSIYLLISKRAPQLSPYILGLIPGSYLLGSDRNLVQRHLRHVAVCQTISLAHLHWYMHSHARYFSRIRELTPERDLIL